MQGISLYNDIDYISFSDSFQLKIPFISDNFGRYTKSVPTLQKLSKDSYLGRGETESIEVKSNLGKIKNVWIWFDILVQRKSEPN